MGVPETYIKGIIELSKVKNWIGPPVNTVTDYDDMIIDASEGIVEEFEGEIQAKIGPPVTRETVLLDGGINRLVLPHLNVAPASVIIWEDIQRKFNPISKTNPITYRVDQARGIVRRVDGGKFAMGYYGAYAMGYYEAYDVGYYGAYDMGYYGGYNMGLEGRPNYQLAIQVIKVQYNGGYNFVTLPSDLRRALMQQISHEFRRRNDPGLSSVSYPDGSINKFNIDEFLPKVQKILDRYRRFSLGIWP